MPRVTWAQLHWNKKLGEGLYSVVYPAFLTLPDDQCVPVIYKVLVDRTQALARCEKEARVLQVLEGVAGVPRLYGVTNPKPHAIVMSYRPGVKLLKYLRQDTVRTYLACLKEACHILTHLHERGVTHKDLHAANILVEVAGDIKVVSVSLVDFGDAVIGGSARHEWDDVQAVVRMVIHGFSVLQEDSEFYSRRDDLSCLTGEDVGLTEVCVALCGFLQGHPADGPPCSLCLLSCIANNSSSLYYSSSGSKRGAAKRRRR